MTEEPPHSERELVKPTPSKPTEAKKAAVDEQSEIMKMSEPNRLTRFMVDRACCFLLSAVFLLLLMAIAVALLGMLNPSDPNTRDYLVWGDKYVTNFDKTQLALTELSLTSTNDKVALQSQAVGNWAIILIYKATSGNSNLWSKESLIAMREFETEIKAMDGYKKTCLAK